MDELSTFITSFVKDPEMAVLLVSYGIGLVAFWKGWIVPKVIYDGTDSRATRAEKALGDMTEALRDLTTEIRQRSMR